MIQEVLLSEARVDKTLQWKFNKRALLAGDYEHVVTGYESIDGIVFKISSYLVDNTMGKRLVITAQSAQQFTAYFMDRTKYLPLDEDIDLIRDPEHGVPHTLDSLRLALKRDIIDQQKGIELQASWQQFYDQHPWRLGPTTIHHPMVKGLKGYTMLTDNWEIFVPTKKTEIFRTNGYFSFVAPRKFQTSAEWKRVQQTGEENWGRGRV